jgi:hypothetical protein
VFLDAFSLQTNCCYKCLACKNPRNIPNAEFQCKQRPGLADYVQPNNIAIEFEYVLAIAGACAVVGIIVRLVGSSLCSSVKWLCVVTVVTLFCVSACRSKCAFACRYLGCWSAAGLARITSLAVAFDGSTRTNFEPKRLKRHSSWRQHGNGKRKREGLRPKLSRSAPGT